MNFPIDNGFYMPAEWHQKQRTFMEWPVRKNAWKELLSDAKHAYANVANAIAEFEPLTMIVSPSLEPEARRLCLHAMRLNIPNYPSIEAPMPEDMQQVINELRKQK